MEKSLLRLVAVLFLVFMVGTCTDGGTESPFDPVLVEEEGEELPIPPMQSAKEILDGWRGGGNPGFHWLYPMVQNTGYSGTFDGSLAPRLTVEVCELDGASCTGGPLKVFSSSGGSYYEIIRVSTRREYYLVYWSTAATTAGSSYRVSVFLDGDTELGHADVKVVSTRNDVGTVDPEENVGIAQGDWLAIRWRLEEGVDEFNTPPEVSITTPPDGANVPEGVVNLQGNASDSQDGDLSAQLAWNSSIDGDLGTGASISPTLSPGNHVITATVSDGGGETGSSSLNLTVSENLPPEVEIGSPQDQQAFKEGETIPLSATATDLVDGDLTPAIQWTVDSQTDPLGSGGDLDVTLPAGTHVLTASATDSQGATGSSSVTVTVRENALPEVTILQPEAGLEVEVGEAFPLQGSAADEEDGDLSSGIRWASDLEGGPLGTGADLTVGLSTPGTHTITASVTDSQGLEGSASVDVVVVVPNNEPSVQITGPVEGAVFEPGDVITLTGTASDPEEGELSDQIEWSSDQDGDIGTGASLSPLLSGGPHLITASITDAAGATATDQVNILVGIVGLQQLVTVPFSDEASLPITLAEPVPPGGLTVTVVSDAPGIVEVRTPTVTIPEGARAGNATVYGITPGEATITASTPDLGSDQSVATVTGEFEFNRNAISFTPAFSDTEVQLGLFSGGSPAIAPPGGLEVTLTAVDAGCIAVPTTVTIPEGEGGVIVPISYGGTTELECETNVGAAAPNVSSAQVTVTALAAPVIQLPPDLFVEGVGSGLLAGASGELSSPDHGGVTVTLTSGDPSKVLLRARQSDGRPAGDIGESITIPVGSGSTRFLFEVHALEDLVGESVTVTATADGFLAGSTTVDIVQPYLNLVGVDAVREIFGDDTRPVALVGVLRQSGTAIDYQPLRPNSPLETTYRSSDATLAAFDIGGGAFSDEVTRPGTAGAILQANAVGTVTITASIPGFLPLNGSDTREMQIIGSDIELSTATPVGRGLMQAFGAFLSERPPENKEVTITSDDPDAFLVSIGTTDPDGDPVAGPSTSMVVNKDGNLRITFYVHALEDAVGPATVTLSAPGFNSATSEIIFADVAYRFGAYDGRGGGAADNTLSTLESGNYRVTVGALRENGGFSSQNVRSDGPGFEVTFTSSDPTVASFLGEGGTLVSTVSGTIDPLQNTTRKNIDPLEAGTSTISSEVQRPDGTPIPAVGAGSGILTVFTPPVIDSRYDAPPTPDGLMRIWYPYLDNTAPEDTPVTIVSSDPSVLQVGPADYSSPGETFVYTVTQGNGQIRMALHGMSEGTATLTLSAPQYGTVTRDVVVGPPSIRLVGVNVNQKTFDPDDGFAVELGYSPEGSNSFSRLPRRFGTGPVTATITNSDPSVGELVKTPEVGDPIVAQTITVTIPEGSENQSEPIAFSPLVNGATTLSVSAPGFNTVDWPSSTITVTSPGIDVRRVPASLGAGLYQTVYGFLGAPNHGGVMVTVESSNPAKILVAEAGGSNPGSSVQVFVADGDTRFDYTVIGVAGETATGVQIKASAQGFLDGTDFVDLVEPRFRFYSLDTSRTVADGANGFRVLVESSNYGFQPVYDPAGLTVTLSVDDPTLAEVGFNGTTGQTVSFTIPQGQYEDYVANPQWIPLAPGTPTLTISAPGVQTFSTPLTIDP